MADGIFDDIKRTEPRPRRRSEGEFTFLNRVDDPAFEQIRGLLESWFERYAVEDEDARHRLRQRVRSGRDEGFTGALWELYLHETFLRLGCDVTVDPPVTGGEIDFLVAREPFRAYVEATVLMVSAISGDDQGPGTASAMDALDDAFHCDFALKVESVLPGRRNPPTAKLTAAAERCMAKYDWEEVRPKLETGGIERLPIDKVEAEGWIVNVVIWPRSSAARGDQDFPTIVMEPPRGGMSFAREAMLKKLRIKARKYRNLGAPYLIALNSLTMAGDDLDVEQALYGPEVVLFDRENPGSTELGRSPQGLWQRGTQTSYSRVSAILVATNFGINAVGKTWPRLWLNPWAAEPLSAPFQLPWPTRTGDLQQNVIEMSDSMVDPAGFFGLPSGWPGEPFAARQRRRRRLA